MQYKQIIITRDNGIRFACERGFEKFVVFGVTTGSDRLFRYDQFPAQAHKIDQSLNIARLYVIFLLNLWTTQNIGNFKHHRRGIDRSEPTIAQGMENFSN